MKNEFKINLWRIIFYIAGGILLAVGITLTTKIGLGVSTIISVPFVISRIWNLDFSVTTFVVYSVMVGIQFLIRGKNNRLSDLLQIPFSLVFSWCLNLFDSVIQIELKLFWEKFLLLIIVLVLTGCGSAMMANMKLIMNPADGLAQTVGEISKKGMGFGKNLIDFFCVALSIVICLIFHGRLIGIGLVTILAMIGLGRIIAIFNFFFKKRMLELSGITFRNHNK